jgi:hypothetical protein
MRKKCIIFFMFYLLLIPCNIFADFFPQMGKEGDRVARKDYALTCILFIQKIDDSIPELSPSQEEWLKKEDAIYEKTKNTTRYWEVYQSKEYDIRFVKRYNRELLNTLELLVSPTLPEEEYYLWSLVATRLLDSEYWNSLYSLSEKQLVDKKNFFSPIFTSWDRDLSFSNNGVIPSRQIIEHILSPYLRELAGI